MGSYIAVFKVLNTSGSYNFAWTPLSADAFVPATCRLGQLWTFC